MTTDFRALCADLLWALENAIRVIYHEDGTKHISTAKPIVNRARAALARWGNPVPAPPVEGEWQTGLPSFAGFYYVRGLLDESIGGDNRPVYVNPKHFVWGFWEQDDPEWIGLDSDITPDNIQWKPVAPLPSPVADGEVAELVAALRADAECVAAEQPDLMQLTDKQLTRAADLLECLEQVAYAASDFICGTRFPEFANEHGGIDRLMADLCRLVAQFEHGPRPVPGVDVPGPDGDWGGLAELCNAEGVDLRIGVPLLQRAREAWKYASQAAPVPAEGEVAELVEWLRSNALTVKKASGNPANGARQRMNRAAELLERQVLVPVPVAERPWEREEWCDTDGLCWLGSHALDGSTPTWLFGPPAWAERFPTVHRVLLPAHALPLPE